MSEFISKLAIKMRHKEIFIFLGLALAVLVGCASTASSSKSSASYFTGSGGKGMSLGILLPESKGLDANQEYLPSMVQGGLVSNISKYSAITVLDRVSLDRVIAETLDPTYKDNLDIVRLGRVAQVGYMMTGNIMRTSTGYTLQLNITETSPNASTIASYSGTSTVAQFDDFSAIQRASKELLKQMGVQLTDAAVNELEKPGSSQTIRAQTNLARGIIAQQRGTTIEAMAYYSNAVSFDPKLAEANGRLSTLSSNITSGNIGQNVRNEIQRRNEWIKILAEAEDFFSKHLPFEIVYSNSLTQGRINYGRETVELNTNITLRPTSNFKILNDILTGLTATGKRDEWGLTYWPLLDQYLAEQIEIGTMSEWDIRRMIESGYTSSYIFSSYGDRDRSRYTGFKKITVTIVLLNETGTIISKADIPLFIEVQFAFIGKGEVHSYDVKKNRYITSYRDRFYGVDINKFEATEKRSIVQFIANANDITDHLTIQVVSVNGVDIAQNPDYIRITAK